MYLYLINCFSLLRWFVGSEVEDISISTVQDECTALP